MARRGSARTGGGRKKMKRKKLITFIADLSQLNVKLIGAKLPEHSEHFKS